MGKPLSADEIGKRIAQDMFDSVKKALPDESGQTVQLNNDQQGLFRAIFDLWGKEMFYGPSPMYQEAMKESVKN